MMAPEPTGPKRITELRVVDLRSELEKRGLVTTGVKSNLVERLQTALLEEGHDPENYEFEVTNEGATSAKTTPRKPRSNEEGGESIELEMMEDNGAAEGFGDDDIPLAKDPDESQDEVSQPPVEDADLEVHADDNNEFDENEEKPLPEPEEEKVKTPVKEEKKPEVKLEPKKEEKPEPIESVNVWISGLPQSTKAAELKKVVGKCGKILSAKIVTNAKAPNSGCYGYVTMVNLDDAKKCVLDLNGSDYNEKKLTVEMTNLDPAGALRASEGKKKAAAKSNAKKVAAKKVEKENEKKSDDKKKKKDDEEVIQVVLDENNKDEEKSRSTRSAPHRRERSRERVDLRRRLTRPPMRTPYRGRGNQSQPYRNSNRGGGGGGGGGGQGFRGRGGYNRPPPPPPPRPSYRQHMDIMREREMERRQRDEVYRIEREREKIRMEREKLERERLDLLRLEREKQKLEREKIAREREELKRRKLDVSTRGVVASKRSYDDSRNGSSGDYYKRKSDYDTGSRSRREDPPIPQKRGRDDWSSRSASGYAPSKDNRSGGGYHSASSTTRGTYHAAGGGLGASGHDYHSSSRDYSNGASSGYAERKVWPSSGGHQGSYSSNYSSGGAGYTSSHTSGSRGYSGSNRRY